MARSDTRFSIYPNPKAVEMVGSSAPELNDAIECWGTLLTRAVADNSRTFSEWIIDDPHSFHHHLHDWCLIAEGLRSARVDPGFPNPGALLASAVEDAIRLGDIDSAWFYEEDPARGDAEYANCIAGLVKKLHELDFSHAWALLLSVRWFWRHKERGIDMEKDKWWTLAFRRKWQSPPEAKQASPEKRARRGKADER